MGTLARQGAIGNAPNDAYFSVEYNDSTFRVTSVTIVNNRDDAIYEVTYRNESVQPPVEDAVQQPPNTSRTVNIPGGRVYLVTDDAWAFSSRMLSA